MAGLGVIRLACAAGLILALGACEGVKKQLGMTKQSPDEFRVVARAPLSLPPDFSLRPPQPGAVRPQEGTPAQQARQAIFRVEDKKITAPEPLAVDSGRSRGELSFLKAAGADNVDKDIRTVVDREADSLQGDETFLQSLVFWREEDKPGTIVDADGEARRLRENSALGKDVSEGETPSIERRQKALFEGIF